MAASVSVSPALAVEPRGAPVGGRPVSGADAAEKTAGKQLEATFELRARKRLLGRRETDGQREVPREEFRSQAPVGWSPEEL